jgi:hypothetical protein
MPREGFNAPLMKSWVKWDRSGAGNDEMELRTAPTMAMAT